ncbi:uncharacterized protein Z520_01072 [Fonsecaea multimorphosa CBS 102226]|uniref:RRM domain-containing protein n=1 Tax=Fonsecaea multimorphosa CBS 102226 TaxID=1442371 RepID=A0A0D2IZT7_9EURO|nr:uncharacterized protein Z520_01072 [Fonsecaea multimorphosa CBS 102226]KIY02607.1 hypothetical protein Z520_01072 [Fonsecaea multimorphosa CBS 102226]OAL31472.1 hypothetical protein AYO22_01064 [Fonsecaea multimorphosa]
MTDADPPPEAQRFGRSQTPESPRPVHIPEPSTIPVLLNQMDPVFNDTETYNIPHNQTFSPYSDSARAMNENDPNDPNSEEQDVVQNFLRGAEEENARLDNSAQFSSTNGQMLQNDAAIESNLVSALANASAYPQSSEAHANPPPGAASQVQDPAQTSNDTSSAADSTVNPDTSNNAQAEGESTSEAEPAVIPSFQTNEGGVDYQSLLDTISKSASTAPAADPVSAPTTATSLANHGAQSLFPIPGLPPKPPSQAQSSDSPAIHTFHNSTNDQLEQYQQVSPDHANANGTDQSALPPAQFQPPPASMQAPGTWGYSGIQASPTSTEPTSPAQSLQAPEQGKAFDANERPWTPSTQALYDSFLEDERRYVTEGIWDKFPQGSRLFVGNLPSEKVTKRDIFQIFHKHGRLAQISIKQAYGFVQYLEASSCQAALQAEQGVEIRGRKIHLEISKPQKNTRGQQGQQGNKRRRSRSPDRGASRQNDRSGRPNYSDFRDERGRRDEYRRSPSPRGYRSRDDYRQPVQSPRYGTGGRPISPFASNFSNPPSAGYDEEATLPLPRRDPRDVPDVQLLILEPSVAPSFMNWIEQGFRNKGLRASTIWLSPRLPLNAVVKRQIIEGVQAVVKLTQANQYNSKIPLQVFDRSQGTSNVNFNEYVDLDVPVAADIALHARQKERGGVQQQSPQSYQPQGYSQYGYAPPPAQYPPAPFPQHHQQPQPQPQPQQHNQYQYGQNAHYHNPAQTPVTPNSATAAPNLQQLLANLRQPGDGQPESATQNGKPTPDLAGLLSNVARQQQGHGGAPFPSPHGPPHQQQQPQQQGYVPGAPAYAAGQQSQQNVQNIMETLARYNR